MANFTPEQLIAFHYQELPAKMIAEIAADLKTNWVLQEKYRVISDATKQLDKAMLAPRNSVLQSILEYSRNQFAPCLHDN